MTEDVTTTSASQLARFDNGVQTYAVSNAGGVYAGVTVLNGTVLVADFGNDVIQKFSPGGTYQGVFATPAFIPVFVESSSAGNVYTTADGLGGAVAQRFNATGALTQSFFGTSGNFLGIDADAAGNVYVAQKTGPNPANLLKFAPTGALINTTPLGTINPWDLAIDETGQRLFIADQASATAGIKVFNIAGAAPVFSTAILTPAQSLIFGVHFAAESGNILAVDSGDFSNDPRGLEYSPIGVLIAQYRPTNIRHGQDITTFVPEPSSAILLLVGMFGVAQKRRRTT